MKKTIKFLLSIAVIICLVLTTVSMSAFAADGDAATIQKLTPNKKEYAVGEQITLTVSFSAKVELIALQGTVTYDPAILEFVSGNGTKNGTDKISTVIDSDFGNTGKKSASYDLTFKAIATGTNYFRFDAKASDTNATPHEGSAGWNIKVVEAAAPQKSNNANLSSITVNAGTLSPKFAANTTEYNVSVPNSTSKITISAAAQDAKATFDGAGTFDLKIGKNTRVITVTAESGAKKSYTLNITRGEQTSSEPTTSTPTPSNPDGDVDPLSVVALDGSIRKIIADITEIPLPIGFTTSTTTVSDRQVGIFVEANGNENYVLYATTDANGEDLGYYYKTDSGYKRLAYIIINNNMYIAETPAGSYSLSSDYYESTMGMNGTNATVFKYSDEKMQDFCIIYCYTNGEYGYYRFDSLETTMQRAPDFSLAKQVGADGNSSEDKGILWRFSNMTTLGKVVVIAIALCAILIIVAVVLIVVKLFINKSNDDDDEDTRFEEVDNNYSGYDLGDDIDISSHSDDDEKIDF